MFEAITQRIRRGTDGAPGTPPAPAALAGTARRTLGPSVLDAECECPDACLRDHDNE